MITGREKLCFSRTGQHYDIIARVEACRKKAQEACLEALKCLKKNVMLHRQLSLDSCGVIFTKNTWLISPKKCF